MADMMDYEWDGNNWRRKRSSNSSGSFHTGGANHDTYREQQRYVDSLGNQYASENFKATKPYFA